MAIKKWKTLDEQVIFEHPRITLIEDTVALPNGNTAKYLRFKRDAHAATIVAVHKDGSVLLQREYSHPPARVLYQFPGGGVPDGEDIAEGANRELMEECGLRGDMELIGEYYNNRRSDAKMYAFVATNLTEATLPADAEEFIECEWHAESAVDAMIAKGEIENVHVLAVWTLFKNWRAKNKAYLA